MRGSIKSIDDSIKNEQRCMQGFQIESNRRKADMDHQINVSHMSHNARHISHYASHMSHDTSHIQCNVDIVKRSVGRQFFTI